MLFFDFLQVYFVNTLFQNLLHCRYCLSTVIRKKYKHMNFDQWHHGIYHK